MLSRTQRALEPGGGLRLRGRRLAAAAAQALGTPKATLALRHFSFSISGLSLM